jgi:D-glycero-D-manno-heptose 1,7-bisphosphate phosphatase
MGARGFIEVWRSPDHGGYRELEEVQVGGRQVGGTPILPAMSCAGESTHRRPAINLQRRCVFLDRDGVLNALVYRPEEGIYDSPYALEEFRLLPRVAEAVRLINRMGMLAIVVSNQPGVAKGKCDLSFLEEVSFELRRRLEKQGARLDGIYYCLHHPEGTVAAYRKVCECRKPRPGLLLQAARDFNIDLRGSYMVGDGEKDLEAALAAGCQAVWVGNGPGRTRGFLRPHLVASDLLEAVYKIAEREGRPWRYSWTQRT